MRNHKHLLPNIILFVIFFCLIAVIFSKINTVHAEQNEVQTSLLSTNNSSVVYLEVPLDFSEDFNPTEDREELLELMKIHDARRKAAYEMLTSARALGYEANHPAVQMAKLQSLMSGEHLFYYYKKYVELGYEAFDEKAKEYPEATYIWLYLKDLGYNDYVCAGIMGNLMAEVGGQTLALKVNVSTSTHYGMCQWSKLYYGEVWGASLPNQCDFLANTIEEQFNIYGFIYKRNFDYSDFLALANEKHAALAFAEVYERCGSASYAVRQKNATKALEYFVS